MTYAYVVLPDSTVDLRKIAIGATEGDLAAIRSGLTPGETVVIDGVDKLQKGSKVAARMQSSTEKAADTQQQASEIVDREKKGT